MVGPLIIGILLTGALVAIIAFLSQYYPYIAGITAFFAFLLGIKVSENIAGFDRRISVLMGLILAGIIFALLYYHTTGLLITTILVLGVYTVINIIFPTNIIGKLIRR